MDERTRRQECALEPIHLPGAIQPYGVLLAVDPGTWQIVQVSANSGTVLAVAASDLLGRPLDVLFEGESKQRLPAAFIAAAEGGINPIPVQVAGKRFDTMVHQVDGLLIAEFEGSGSLTTGQDFIPALQASIRRLSLAADLQDLQTLVARELRRLTGFDQVMVYHFHPDGHGEVVADERAEGMQAYLGLHFPASDIPAQARRLYLLKASQLIASSDYQPAVLIPPDNPHTGAPLDLSAAELRSVSPYHLQFMRNMGQGSSMTFPLVHDGHLRGMITCAHRQPRHVPYVMRRGYEVIAQQVTLQLVAMEQTRSLTRRLQTQHVRTQLVEQMIGKLDVAGGLVGADVTVLDLVTADGATMRLHQALTSVGHTPTDEQTTALLARIAAAPAAEAPLVSDALAVDHPDLAVLAPSIAGLVVLPFGAGDDYLLWFRREVTQSINWLGEQAIGNRATTLSPRSSFQLWRQTVTDRSIAWDQAEIAEAVQLRRDIDNVLLRRAEAQLAHMGLHDSLTGLPNRNLLLDRVTSTVARADRDGEQVVVLFCDLDGFKRVNDTAGHTAGDAVLIEVAHRLRGVLRAGDSIARVGGDEFVIVLEPARRATPLEMVPGRRARDKHNGHVPGPGDGQDAGQVATLLAERVRTELARPFSYKGREHVISVSVGMTFAQPGSLAEDLLRDADTAMYRAKHEGKNRVEVFDDSLRADILERARVERALRSALTPGGPDLPHLSVAYQPVIDLGTGGLVSFEALARLTDSDGKPIRPCVLISVAEENGLISGLGEVVLERALEGIVRWRAEHHTAIPTTISVNFSARQAQRADMTTVVRDALDRHGLHPADLTLEITESVLLEAGSSTLRQLSELHAAGVGIAIDDFGTGYASLRHLAILPIDTVKVDKSFTAGLAIDPASTAIVSAVAGLARDMGLHCVIEGIETEKQLAAVPPGVLGQGNLLGAATASPQNTTWTRSV